MLLKNKIKDDKKGNKKHAVNSSKKGHGTLAVNSKAP